MLSTIILPIQGGNSQSTDTANVIRLKELQQEIDSIKVQKQLYLDLLEYQIERDSINQEPTKK